MAERARFLIANNGDHAKAAAAVQEYLAWRREYLPKARQVWAAHGGKDVPWLGFLEGDGSSGSGGSGGGGGGSGGSGGNRNGSGGSGGNRNSSGGDRNGGRRRVLRDNMHHGRVVFIQGAQINLDVPVDVLVACIVVFFDRSFARDGREMVTVLLDLRKGPPEWQNNPGHTLVPLARAFNAVFKPQFPERLRKMVIYPMPWYGLAVWNIVTLFLDTKTATKMHLLKGPTEPESTNPFVYAPDPEQLKEYVDEMPTMDMIIGGGVSPVMGEAVKGDEELEEEKLEEAAGEEEEEEEECDIEL
jgi:hypothetical protein